METSEQRRLATCTGLVLLTILASAAPASAGWSRSVRLDEPGTWQEFQSVATSGEAVHLVWSARTYRQAKTEGIYYRRSQDCGESWTSPTLLAEVPLDLHGLEVAAWGDDVHLVWNQRKSSRLGVYYSVSRDGGSSWSEPRKISDATKHAYQPAIAAVADTVVVAYRRGGHTGRRLVIEVSSDAGRGWARHILPRREEYVGGFLTHDVALEADPSGDVKRVHLAISTVPSSKTASRVWLQSSESLGRSWFRPLLLDEGRKGGFRSTVDLQMKASDSGVQVVWSRQPRLEILHKRTAGGEAGRESFLTDPSSRRGRYQQGFGPKLALSGGGKVLRAGWVEHHEGKRNGAVKVSRSSDHGRSWGRPKRLAKGTRLGVSLATSPGSSCRGASHLVYRRATTGDGDLTRLFYRRRPAELPQTKAGDSR